MRALALTATLAMALASCCDDEGTLLISIALADGRLCLTSGVGRVFIEVEDPAGALVVATDLPCLELETQSPTPLGDLPAGLYEVRTRAHSPDGGLLYASDDLVSVLCGEPSESRLVLGFVGDKGTP